MFRTVVCDLRGIRYLILQGSMQDGGVRADIAVVRSCTDRSFGVNMLRDATRLAQRMPARAKG